MAPLWHLMTPTRQSGMFFFHVPNSLLWCGLLFFYVPSNPLWWNVIHFMLQTPKNQSLWVLE
jgi:hypothetical protein